jgi:hypothetical protein
MERLANGDFLQVTSIILPAGTGRIMKNTLTFLTLLAGIVHHVVPFFCVHVVGLVG